MGTLCKVDFILSTTSLQLSPAGTGIGMVILGVLYVAGWQSFNGALSKRHWVRVVQGRASGGRRRFNGALWEQALPPLADLPLLPATVSMEPCGNGRWAVTATHYRGESSRFNGALWGRALARPSDQCRLGFNGALWEQALPLLDATDFPI